MTKIDIKFNNGDPILVVEGMTLDDSEDSDRARAFTFAEATAFYNEFGAALRQLALGRAQLVSEQAKSYPIDGSLIVDRHASRIKTKQSPTYGRAAVVPEIPPGYLEEKRK